MMRVSQILHKPSRASLRDRTLLLAHLLGISHKELYLKDDLLVGSDVEEAFRRGIDRLESGYPLQYLIGEWEFYGLSFYVQEGVLIPRPETELLVEECLRRLPVNSSAFGLELGVGSGCISISLLLHRKALKMLAVDINPRALTLARRNAQRHGVTDRLHILGSDLFSGIRPFPFDFILSNPPYIPAHAWDSLPEGVRLEGYNSLIAGMKGWEFYQRISVAMDSYLSPSGFFCFEIGHDQGKVVSEIFEKKGYKVKLLRDYSGQERVIAGWRL